MSWNEDAWNAATLKDSEITPNSSEHNFYEIGIDFSITAIFPSGYACARFFPSSDQANPFYPMQVNIYNTGYADGTSFGSYLINYDYEISPFDITRSPTGYTPIGSEDVAKSQDQVLTEAFPEQNIEINQRFKIATIPFVEAPSESFLNSFQIRKCAGNLSFNQLVFGQGNQSSISISGSGIASSFNPTSIGTEIIYDIDSYSLKNITSIPNQPPILFNGTCQIYTEKVEKFSKEDVLLYDLYKAFHERYVYYAISSAKPFLKNIPPTDLIDYYPVNFAEINLDSYSNVRNQFSRLIETAYSFQERFVSPHAYDEDLLNLNSWFSSGVEFHDQYRKTFIPSNKGYIYNYKCSNVLDKTYSKYKRSLVPKASYSPSILDPIVESPFNGMQNLRPNCYDSNYFSESFLSSNFEDDKVVFEFDPSGLYLGSSTQSDLSLRNPFWQDNHFYYQSAGWEFTDESAQRTRELVSGDGWNCSANFLAFSDYSTYEFSLERVGNRYDYENPWDYFLINGSGCYGCSYYNFVPENDLYLEAKIYKTDQGGTKQELWSTGYSGQIDQTSFIDSDTNFSATINTYSDHIYISPFISSIPIQQTRIDTDEAETWEYTHQNSITPIGFSEKKNALQAKVSGSNPYYKAISADYRIIKYYGNYRNWFGSAGNDLYTGTPETALDWSWNINDQATFTGQNYKVSFLPPTDESNQVSDLKYLSNAWEIRNILTKKCNLIASNIPSANQKFSVYNVQEGVYDEESGETYYSSCPPNQPSGIHSNIADGTQLSQLYYYERQMTASQQYDTNCFDTGTETFYPCVYEDTYCYWGIFNPVNSCTIRKNFYTPNGSIDYLNIGSSFGADFYACPIDTFQMYEKDLYFVNGDCISGHDNCSFIDTTQPIQKIGNMSIGQNISGFYANINISTGDYLGGDVSWTFNQDDLILDVETSGNPYEPQSEISNYKETVEEYRLHKSLGYFSIIIKPNYEYE